jgi:hypothetical protein
MSEKQSSNDEGGEVITLDFGMVRKRESSVPADSEIPSSLINIDYGCKPNINSQEKDSEDKDDDPFPPAA